MSVIDSFTDNTSSVREITDAELDQIAGGITAIEVGLIATGLAIAAIAQVNGVPSQVGAALAPVPVVGPIVG